MATAVLRTFEKRVFDDRVFSVNVAGNLISGDNITGFSSVAVTTISPDVKDAANTSLVVSAYATPYVNGEFGGDDGNWLRFGCLGGIAGEKYLVTLRYTSDTDTALESVVQVNVT